MLVGGLEKFLDENPLMRLEPIGLTDNLVISGKVLLNLKDNGYPQIKEELKLQIEIPRSYPSQAPLFKEVGGCIPQSDEYHINNDGSMCLGSPFKIDVSLAENSCLSDFFNKFFIPYIYALLLKLKHKIDFIYGELSHGVAGEVEDFMELFGVRRKQEVLDCLSALGLKKRISNKHKCPCGCGERLGVCKLHLTLNSYRNRLPRSKYKIFWNKLGG